MVAEAPELEPRIINGPRQFVAVSSSHLALRIGVVAPTEEEARRRFSAEIAAWRELRERRIAEESGQGCPE